MFIQTCLQRTIPTSQLIITIRTFKRFGEYVKGYGHESQYDQGGRSNARVYRREKRVFVLLKVIFHEHHI